jgi:adenylate cyclase
VLAHRGEIVKRLGDGLMAAFWDAPAAIEAAVEMYGCVGAVEVSGHRPLLRAGIHVGRPRRIGGDYFGVDVNIAARLVEAAEPGEILVSDRALDGPAPDGLRARERTVEAKGVPDGLRAHALTPSPAAPASA